MTKTTKESGVGEVLTSYFTSFIYTLKDSTAQVGIKYILTR